MIISLNSNKHGTHEALIDDNDFFTLLNGWVFYLWGTPRHTGLYLMGYSPENRRTPVRVHRYIVGAKTGEIVDHINRNPLDNRRENLRIITSVGNNQNSTRRKGNHSSVYRGVTLSPVGNWIAQIQVNKKKISLGTFKTEMEAALAYDAYVIKIGSYHVLNFPDNLLKSG